MREGHPAVRDLSLHLADLMENSLRAGASVIAVSIEVSCRDDLLTIRVEDDGPGFSVLPEVAVDPFYTTKEGKRTGLGLSLMRAAAERAGGGLTLGRSPLGGALVEARMPLSHPDRSPLGNVAATVSSVAGTSPGVDVRLAVTADAGAFSVSSHEAAAGLPEGGRGPVAVARELSKRMAAGMAEVWPGQAW